MHARDSIQGHSALRNVGLHVLTHDERGITVGELYDYRRFNFSSGSQNGVDEVDTHAANNRQSKVVFFNYLENLLYVTTSGYAWSYEIKNFRHIVNPVSSASGRMRVLKRANS